MDSSLQGRRRSEDDAYVELLNRFKKPLYRLILCMVRSSADAEDVFQQTAITMWDKFSEFELGSDFFAWASTIARYKVRDYIKAKARQRVYFSDALIDQLIVEGRGAAEDELRLKALEDCRKKLTVADQQLLVECYGGERTIMEIAARSGRVVGGVYNSLWRIRRALYGCIERAVAREGRVA